MKTDFFIKKAIEVHGNKYDYSTTECIKGQKKVFILCSIHGKFEQSVYDHLRGNGCDRCSGTYKHTNESFIVRSNLVHNNKYDYSLVKYEGNKKKITIICKLHGKFEQRPGEHLKGIGCDRCGGTCKLNTYEFIQKAKLIHGDKYIYDNVIYDTSNKQVKIICKIHGEFAQIANAHLSGYGCRKCANALLTLTNDEFIFKSKIIHGDTYNYDSVQYENCRKKVNIFCNIHGMFSQKASLHLEGKGCKLCCNNISKQEIKWLNYLNISEEYRHKSIKANNKWYFLDGLNPTTNTIYEFYGDYWHGNPDKFKANDINKKNKYTFGQLYQDTIIRENQLRALGYNIIAIWENDWKKIQKSMK